MSRITVTGRTFTSQSLDRFLVEHSDQLILFDHCDFQLDTPVVCLGLTIDGMIFALFSHCTNVHLSGNRHALRVSSPVATE